MSDTKHVNKWTKKELRKLPKKELVEEISEFDSLVILPTKHIHDSRFRIMEFVVVIEGIPRFRISGCSDVIH